MRIIRKKGIVILTICLMAICLAIGCTTTKNMTENIVPGGKALKKKIAFLPTVNKMGSGGEYLQKSARTHLETYLKDFCDDLIIVDSLKTRDLLEKIPRLPSGQLDNLALVKLGRVLGLNAVLEESVSEIECLEDKRGIWGFRNPCLLGKLGVRVSALDIETGAILFDEVVRVEVTVSEHDWQRIKERGGYDREIAEQLLTKTMDRICQRVCDLLGDSPWKGYVSSVSENTFTLTAGEDVGLATGDVLEVFGANEPIKGHAGQFYLVARPKIGELRVTGVLKNQAEAIGILGSDLQNSSCVRLKR